MYILSGPDLACNSSAQHPNYDALLFLFRFFGHPPPGGHDLFQHCRHRSHTRCIHYAEQNEEAQEVKKIQQVEPGPMNALQKQKRTIAGSPLPFNIACI